MSYKVGLKQFLNVDFPSESASYNPIELISGNKLNPISNRIDIWI